MSYSVLSPRVSRLKCEYLAAKPNISAVRAKAFTDIYKQYPGIERHVKLTHLSSQCAHKNDPPWTTVL